MDCTEQATIARASADLSARACNQTSDLQSTTDDRRRPTGRSALFGPRSFGPYPRAKTPSLQSLIRFSLAPFAALREKSSFVPFVVKTVFGSLVAAARVSRSALSCSLVRPALSAG
jgi:hypothetical protein